MDGCIFVIVIFVMVIVVGGGMWYVQEYGFYDRIDFLMVYLIVMCNGVFVVFSIDVVQVIDVGSLFICWWVCFQFLELLFDGVEFFFDVMLLVLLNWFFCFDVGWIQVDLVFGVV